MPPVDVAKVRRRYRDDVHRKMDKTGGLERAVQVGKSDGAQLKNLSWQLLKLAQQSSDYKKIYSVIIDSYHTTTVVKPVAEDAFMLQAAHVINIYNTMNRSYSNAHVFLLLPLQARNR